MTELRVNLSYQRLCGIEQATLLRRSEARDVSAGRLILLISLIILCCSACLEAGSYFASSCLTEVNIARGSFLSIILTLYFEHEWYSRFKWLAQRWRLQMMHSLYTRTDTLSQFLTSQFHMVTCKSLTANSARQRQPRCLYVWYPFDESCDNHYYNLHGTEAMIQRRLKFQWLSMFRNPIFCP